MTPLLKHVAALLFALCFVCGCGRPSSAQREELVAFMSQQIDLGSLHATDDSVKSHLLQLTGPKIVHYVDSLACVSCKLLSFRLWGVVRARMKVPVVLVVQTSDVRSVDFQLVALNLKLPILYDTTNQFCTTYRIHKEPYRTFLLDENHYPLVIGNPIGNDKLWNLYEQALWR